MKQEIHELIVEGTLSFLMYISSPIQISNWQELHIEISQIIVDINQLQKKGVLKLKACRF
mgnify:CR=1 FL=1